jgi:hypothetical protein
MAYRSLSRPLSPINAKAFIMCHLLLELNYELILRSPALQPKGTVQFAVRSIYADRCSLRCLDCFKRLSPLVLSCADIKELLTLNWIDRKTITSQLAAVDSTELP